jgi:ankyrin repeat protein
MEGIMIRISGQIILLIALLACIGCGRQDKSSQPPAQSATALPRVDLHSAVVTNNLEVIRQHIKAASDLNVLEPSRESTPLITAAFLGRTEAAKMLIEAGAVLNYRNADSSTALHTAAAFGRTEVARLLIESGADLNLQNNHGSTALHTAAFLCRVDIVKALLEKGADKTLRNKAGQTALQTVASPFEDVKEVYNAIGTGMKPLGLQLDYDYIQKTRPEIAALLK